MLQGNWAIVFNLMAIAMLTFMVANVAVSLLVSGLNKSFLRLEVVSRRYALWLVVSLPWTMSLIIALCFFHPLLEYSPLSSVEGVAHWHHMQEFHFASWHGVSLMFALLFLSVWVGRNVRSLVQHSQKLSVLRNLATQISGRVYELESREAHVFASGFFKPRCYITSRMREVLSERETSIVLAHEQAHIARFDPAKKWLFSFFSGFFFYPVSQRLKQHMTLVMEQQADQAIEGHSPLDVASTLVKVARLSSDKVIAQPTMVAQFAAELLEQRVLFLLGKNENLKVNKGLGLLLFTCLLIVCSSSVDAIHHLIENWFSHT